MPSGSRRKLNLPASLKEERLERKLVLAFGLMLLIPLLFVVWGITFEADLRLVIAFILASACIAYITIAHRIIRAVSTIAKRVRAISSHQGLSTVGTNGQNEIGELAKSVTRLTDELEHKIDEVDERAYVETIKALALAVEAKDQYSAGHSKRVGFYAMKIGEQLGLEAETLRMLQDAGILHDIGKIGIKDEILLKPAPLTPEEQKIMQQHSVIGEAIVKPVRSLQEVVALVRHHHERYDGGGYPGKLRAGQIPLGARILAVADTYDALITDRPYRKRLSLEMARREIRRCAGTQLDPLVVQALLWFLDDKKQRAAAIKFHAESTV